MDVDKFLDFLGRAHLVCYAGTEEQRAKIKSKQGDKTVYRFDDGDFKFLDSYTGSLEFKGREFVYLKREPVWVMDYKGLCIVPELNKEVTEFLRKALRNFPSKMPFRGPERLPDQDTLDGFVYTFEFEGNYKTGCGNEIITHQGKEVYSLRCKWHLIE